jgi:hypothetical protein
VPVYSAAVPNYYGAKLRRCPTDTTLVCFGSDVFPHIFRRTQTFSPAIYFILFVWDSRSQITKVTTWIETFILNMHTYYMSRWYCNKSKSQLTSPTPAQAASCCIISGTYSILAFSKNWKLKLVNLPSILFSNQYIYEKHAPLFEAPMPSQKLFKQWQAMKCLDKKSDIRNIIYFLI